jgi:Uma2 family endonuclease
MSTLRKQRFYTLAEYYELVKESEERYEYWNGEIFLMGGASPEHVFITDNIFNSITRQLEGRNCRAISNDIRLKVPTAPPFRYADLTVACGELIFENIEGLRALVNPISGTAGIRVKIGHNPVVLLVIDKFVILSKN